jgi:hypothetical protein
MTKSKHISEETLEQYYKGRVPEPDVAGVEEHLDWCDDCLGHLEAAGRYMQTVRLAARMDNSDSHGQKQTPPHLYRRA